MGFGSRPRLHTQWKVLWGGVVLLILVYVHLTSSVNFPVGFCKFIIYATP